MNSEFHPLLWLVPLLFIPAFVGLWCGIAALLSLLGGWWGLARRYRGRPQRAVASVRFASGTLGRLAVAYRSCLSVSVGPEGVGLAVFPLLRFLHPPLLIPWEAIARCEADRMLGIADRVRLEVREPRTRITLYGRAARLAREGSPGTAGCPDPPLPPVGEGARDAGSGR